MEKSENKNIEHFDKSSSCYDQQFGLSVKLARSRAEFIRRNAKIELTGRVLDLGCGTGNLTIALSLEGMATECIGLDISLGMLRESRIKSQEYADVSYIAASALNLPFGNETFDYCVGDAFLHHVVDAKACLKEVYRVLKPRGMATFNEPSRDGYAFFEMLLRAVIGSGIDPALDDYIHYLSFMREHEGNLKALEDYPLPDKHVFSEKAIRKMDTSFRRIEFFPALDYWPDMWRDSINAILKEIGPKEPIKTKLVTAAEYVDKVLGEPARLHFCLHNQIFLYK